MCGIAGLYKGLIDIDCERDITRMTDAISHRGPDASGAFIENGFALGHRRLSIIDLSSGANQPMHSSCGRYVMVYNGEVYNYKEIEKELGITPKTSSDTEIILEAFIRKGVDFVNMLNGMFAIAIYDRIEQKIFFFRDRMGIKPLFYFIEGETIVFASEIKAILAVPSIREHLKLNLQAIPEYLHLGFISEPKTIYDKIYRLPSGSYADFSSTKGLAITKWWNIEDKIAENKITSHDEAKSKLNDLLKQSVKYRMISDVPFGTFLSGGTDSSLVTALAQSQSILPVNTFTVGFENIKYDESSHAREIAKFLGTKHHEIEVSEKDALTFLPEITNIYDEPYADSSALPTLLISKIAKQHVSMILSGDGGDELFLGYGEHQWAKRFDNILLKATKKPLSKVLDLLPSRYKRVARLLDYGEGSGNLQQHIFSQEQCLFTKNEIDILLSKSKISKLEYSEETYLGKTLVDKQVIFDLKKYLKDDLLVKVDRASMVHSLEVRVPLLDYRIVELAINIDDKLKKDKSGTKLLLKEILYDYVPKELFDRPKWGFSIPLQEWLSTDLRWLIDEYLDEEKLRRVGLFNIEYIAQLKRRFLYKGESYLYNRLWLLIVLMMWFEKNGVEELH